jgi:hypothetical protein
MFADPISRTQISATPFSPGMRADQAVHRLFGAFIDELTFAIRNTAISGSLANAMLFSRPLHSQRHASFYLPAEPRVTSSLAIKLSGLFDGDFPHDALSGFHSAVRAASSHTINIEDLTARGSQPSAAALQACSMAWRIAAGVAATMLDQIASAATAAGYPLLLDFQAHTLDLKAVSDGGSPCVSDDGDLKIPAWTERRNERRRPLGCGGLLYSRTGRQRVIVADISSSGLGLSRCAGLSTGDLVTVELATGRTLSGCAVWVDGQRAGVQLREPLSLNDPLLQTATP